ncbi:TetR/AcrR family transcriptional regulator [Undibacterium parvum]|uniref:TetR/AcrR family transcriptional regulator n=2 Tax=Undibacterium TaxID=401469 RepID=A0A6M4A202_9BURK|nr:TetR/AcrR family transcriptional regulator [Undibacterium parvum]AZP10720.1 TetR/AcrR family transcriptional regulator [Undibacterium parvum]QJQ05331.1 TetR/AcrR family transcriptional regulator [Undibacterium piscinae]
MTAPVRLTDRKRLAILEAAIAEFRQHGFEATSMDKIAATALVSKRTVYNHFASKDELFAAILMELWDSSAAQGDLNYQSERTVRAQLSDYLQRKMRLLCDPNFIDLARVAVAATIHNPERAREMVARLSQREEGIAAWMKAAQADGKLKPGDPVLLSDLLQGQLKAVAFWPQVAMGQPLLNLQQQQKVLELTLEMFLLLNER